LTDERLAWMAAQAHCEKKSFAPPPGYVLMLIVSLGQVARTYRAKAKETLHDYAFAVDDLTRRLTPDERTALRTKGTLPDWFLPTADAEMVKVRKSRPA
jgi:hypothetical protein